MILGLFAVVIVVGAVVLVARLLMKGVGSRNQPSSGPPPNGFRILGTVVVIMVAVVWWASSRPTQEDDAYRVCKDFTTKQLKSPATAAYPSLSTLKKANGYGIRKKTETEYEVTAYVDAQNGFAALIRSDFVCDVKSDGQYWRGSSTLLQ